MAHLKCLFNLSNNLSQKLHIMNAPIQSQLSEGRKRHLCIIGGKQRLAIKIKTAFFAMIGMLI